jgi:hypothetical protein
LTTIIAKIENSELSSAANIGRHGLRRHFTQMKILQPKRIAFFRIRHLGRSPSERATDVGLRVTAHFRLPFALVAAQKKAAGEGGLE